MFVFNLCALFEGRLWSFAECMIDHWMRSAAQENENCY